MEDNNLIEIPNFNNYKLDKVKNEVFNTKTNNYIKNRLTTSYYRVKLSNNNHSQCYLLHRIIYTVFNPEIDISTLEITHIDNNKLNNNIENLKIINNNPLVDINDCPNHKFNLTINQVFSIKHKRYLTNCLNNEGYYCVVLRKNGQRYSPKIHQLVYQCSNPNENINKLVIDHIDRNKLNNNISNLRLVTRSENGCNISIPKNNTSGYKNITIRGNLYIVRITKNKKIYSKSFTNLSDAILHRDIKLIELHGKFACRG